MRIHLVAYLDLSCSPRISDRARFVCHTIPSHYHPGQIATPRDLALDQNFPKYPLGALYPVGKVPGNVVSGLPGSKFYLVLQLAAGGYRVQQSVTPGDPS